MNERNRKVLIDRDRLNQADKAEVARACVTIFDQVQRLPKHIQLMGLAAAFILTANASGIPAQDAFTATKNLMHDPLTSTGIAPQFQAMDYHLRTEVLA
jgi:hypothetical protein